MFACSYLFIRNISATQGMRFCELIKDDLAALAELPESTPELEAA